MKPKAQNVNPTKTLTNLNIKVSEEWFNLINKGSSKVIVYPRLLNTTPNQNYIVSLVVNDETKVSYIATLRNNIFGNIFSIFNNIYSIFDTNQGKAWLTYQRLNQLTNYITTTNEIETIDDNFPLSVFNIIDETSCQPSPTKEGDGYVKSINK